MLPSLLYDLSTRGRSYRVQDGINQTEPSKDSSPLVQRLMLGRERLQYFQTSLSAIWCRIAACRCATRGRTLVHQRHPLRFPIGEVTSGADKMLHQLPQNVACTIPHAWIREPQRLWLNLK
jgi:hypothetical protein